jgi:hypothetical protein
MQPPRYMYVILTAVVSLEQSSSKGKALILSRIGYVTRLISSRQGCSDYLLRFAYTLMDFTIIPLELYVLLSWLTSSISCLWQFWAYVGVLRTGYGTPFTKVRSLMFGNPLLWKRLVSSVVTQWTFHFWGNAFVDSAIPTQRLTVITFPWKCLLQTRYNMIPDINTGSCIIIRCIRVNCSPCVG